VSAPLPKSGPAAETKLEEVPAPSGGGVLHLIRKLRAFLREARGVFREGGFKALFRRYGWKLIAVFFVYYLIRDSILYIILPYLVVRGIIG
jgi:hypothetical protein